MLSWLDIPNLNKDGIEYGWNSFEYTIDVQATSGLINGCFDCIDALDFEEYIKKKVPVKHFY